MFVRNQPFQIHNLHDIYGAKIMTMDTLMDYYQ